MCLFHSGMERIFGRGMFGGGILCGFVVSSILAGTDLVMLPFHFWMEQTLGRDTSGDGILYGLPICFDLPRLACVLSIPGWKEPLAGAYLTYFWLWHPVCSCGPSILGWKGPGQVAFPSWDGRSLWQGYF